MMLYASEVVGIPRALQLHRGTAVDEIGRLLKEVILFILLLELWPACPKQMLLTGICHGVLLIQKTSLIEIIVGACSLLSIFQIADIY